VIIIMAILAAVTGPRFAGAITNHRVENAARRVVADLTLARQQAMTRSASVTVTFTVATDSYQLAGIPHLDRPSEVYAVSLAEEPYQAKIVSAVFDGEAEVIFDGYGVPDSGGSVVIQVGNRQETVVVDADTGEAGVQ